MIIFYIVCGLFVFVSSGLFMHMNRLATYRRRVVRYLASNRKQTPFILSETQEQKIKECFSRGFNIDECFEQL